MIWKWPTIISSERTSVGLFSFGYLDENSRQGEHYKISVCHMNFPPTLIRENNVVKGIWDELTQAYIGVKFLVVDGWEVHLHATFYLASHKLFQGDGILCIFLIPAMDVSITMLD